MSMFSKLKQIKDLRSKAKTMQAALAEEMIEDEHKGIVIKIDGNQLVHQITVPQDALTDKVKLEANLVDAFNSAIKKGQKAMVAKLQKMGELNLPGMN